MYGQDVNRLLPERWTEAGEVKRLAMERQLDTMFGLGKSSSSLGEGGPGL